jgi:hypothetical protein
MYSESILLLAGAWQLYRMQVGTHICDSLGNVGGKLWEDMQEECVLSPLQE